jgi:glycosyltransferase involved in cell wall biosynthesis
VVPSERIAIVPTGVRASDYQSTRDRQHIRTTLGIDEQTSAIGVVAALSPQKGHHYLLEAMQRVLQNTEAVLLVAGSGVLQPALVAQAQKLGIADRVRWLGHREDVPELLHALDLFVLPSLWEGLPYALLEAMAAGVPVVATAIAGNVDLIDGHTTGWLASAADAHGLSEAILQPLTEPAETVRRAAVAQKLVTEKYSLDSMIEHHVRLYRHHRSG